MIRHPPNSTLFPSPTLFRSHWELSVPRGAASPPRSSRRHSSSMKWKCAGRVGSRNVSRSFRRHRDRKSTRVNSSHGYISYAVFCLKKKKKKKTESTTQLEET